MARQRRPNAGTAARRQQILEAARESFVEHGVDGTSLRTIAARAGMTHAGLLHHYRSKDELVVALLQQRDAEEAARSGVSERAPDDTTATPLLRQLLVERQSTPDLLRLWLEVTAAAARPAHPAHDYFSRRYAAVRAAITEDARSRAAAGDLRDDVVPEHFGALMAAVLDGLQLQWLHDHDLPVVDVAEHFLELMLPTGAATSAAARPQSDDGPRLRRANDHPPVHVRPSTDATES